MKRTIFYSWQSDLPNNSNRGFIESCLKRTIQDVDKVMPFQLEFNIDRDTKLEIGTPNILESIFKKIERSKIFIADISIINSDSAGRKCPNPNVLIELGYAARVLGWERVFCFYNTDYGSVEDLPFDLRQRRPIQYGLNGKNKSEVRKSIVQILTDSIIQIHENGGLFDKIDDYIKQKVDTEILTIAGHLGKLLFGYKGKSAPEMLQLVTNLTNEEIEKNIKAQKLIGFQIFKNFQIHEKKFREIADSAISSVHQNREMARPLVELVSWVSRYDALNSPRNKDTWFKEINESSIDYKIVPPSKMAKNDDLPNRYILLKKIDEEKGVVTDFGDFTYLQRIQSLLNYYELNEENVATLISIIRHFIDAVDDWLNLTNGEIIIDLYHNFEIKKTKHNTQYSQKGV